MKRMTNMKVYSDADASPSELQILVTITGATSNNFNLVMREARAS